jgi:hypothetical protein
MAKLNNREIERTSLETELKKGLQRADEDLNIMERHAEDLAMVESGIQSSMRKWDREYKDAHFHSVPRGTKHQP